MKKPSKRHTNTVKRSQINTDNMWSIVGVVLTALSHGWARALPDWIYLTSQIVNFCKDRFIYLYLGTHYVIFYTYETESQQIGI